MSADLIAKCGRRGGCNQATSCLSAGECHYTGSPFQSAQSIAPDMVNHPPHYGGENNPYEVIKVLFAWKLDKNFCLGNAVKYIARHDHKDNALEDLKKARWYLDEEIKQRERMS